MFRSLYEKPMDLALTVAAVGVEQIASLVGVIGRWVPATPASGSSKKRRG